MAKMVTTLVRLEPELIGLLDALRGDVPRAAYIRRVLTEHTASNDRLREMWDRQPPGTAQALMASTPENREIVRRLTGEPSRKLGATKGVAAPFKSRLKGEWKAP